MVEITNVFKSGMNHWNVIIETAPEKKEQIKILASFKIEAKKINRHLLKISFDKEEDGERIDITFHPEIKKEITINTTSNEGFIEVKIE